MKLLIIYHSGVGNTKMVAHKIQEQLKIKHTTQLHSVEKLPEEINLQAYDGIVLGFPTIHTHPTKRILEFLEQINSLKKSIPVYIFTTFGLYSSNTVRIFSKICIKNNLIPIVYNSYRCAATDGVLLAPYIKAFYKHEKNLEKKIIRDCKEFVEKLENSDCQVKIPRFKLYSILNYPNKRLGHYITFPIYLHKDNCTKCGKCIVNCPAKAFSKDEDEYPVFEKEKCEKCYRCIHHCPQKALSLSRNS